jgi:phenylalanyl-tRNA synthetase beta chain
MLVQVPFYRKDIMHPYDIIEDVAIAYDYKKIKPEPLVSYTTGKTSDINHFIDLAREIVLGLGYQEIMSAILSNKETLYKNMNLEDFGTVEIKECMSERYSAVRTWLLPILMEALSKNKHAEYPQKIFEEGLLTERKENQIKDIHRIALITSHTTANYTEARQALDLLMRTLGVNYEVKETEHPSFMQGRVARIYVKDKAVAYLGEISPQVLENWGLTMPAAGFELNLTELFGHIK